MRKEQPELGHTEDPVGWVPFWLLQQACVPVAVHTNWCLIAAELFDVWQMHLPAAGDILDAEEAHDLAPDHGARKG